MTAHNRKQKCYRCDCKLNRDLRLPKSNDGFIFCVERSGFEIPLIRNYIVFYRLRISIYFLYINQSKVDTTKMIVNGI